MKKKAIFKILAIVVLLVGIVFLGLTVNGILQGNKYYDQFRKIGVKVRDVYSDAGDKGLDQVKDDYRGTNAMVDKIDALGGANAQTALEDVHTAYGLTDTIEATESIVKSLKALGTEEGKKLLTEVYREIGEADDAYAAVKAFGADVAETYLEDIEAAVENDGEDARAALDRSYEELEKDELKKVNSYLDFVFGLIKKAGSELGLPYMSDVVANSDQTYLDFARQRILEKKNDPESGVTEETLQYYSDIFRLIDDQGTENAKTYIEAILKAMDEKGVNDAREFLDDFYADTPANKTTRAYLDSIFATIDSQGIEYAKAHGGDICTLVTKEETDQAATFLGAIRDAETAAEKAESDREKMNLLTEAIGKAGKADGNRYLAGLLAVSEEIDKAVKAESKAVDKADKSAQAQDEAQKAVDDAQAALNAAAAGDKEAAQAALDEAKTALDKATDKAEKDRNSADKKRVTDEMAKDYASQLMSAVDNAEKRTSEEGRAMVQEYQNEVSGLFGEIGATKAVKYLTNASSKALDDQTLRISELGTDNAAKLEALDGFALFCMQNKAKLLMAAIALLVAGIVLLCIKPAENNQPRLSRAERAEQGHHMGLKTSRMIANSIIHAVLVVISVIWLIPFISIVLQSLRVESTHQVGYIMPEKLGLYNYIDLLKTDFPTWYLNTFIMALVVAVLQTVIVLCMSYTLSRFRFKMRKPLMSFMLILGMFPGMLTMIILYRVLSDLGLTQANAVPGLILVYIASSGMGYYVSKGFFDTIPKSLDEAARVDGATRFQVLKKIILPLAKPIVIYTILTAFMGPWGDYVFARYISFGTSKGMNVAVGLYNWLNKDQIASRYTMFCAGGVLVAIPVAILFMCLQKYYVEGVTGGAVKG